MGNMLTFKRCVTMYIHMYIEMPEIDPILIGLPLVSKKN